MARTSTGKNRCSINQSIELSCLFVGFLALYLLFRFVGSYLLSGFLHFSLSSEIHKITCIPDSMFSTFILENSLKCIYKITSAWLRTLIKSLIQHWGKERIHVRSDDNHEKTKGEPRGLKNVSYFLIILWERCPKYRDNGFRCVVNKRGGK